MTVSIKSPTSTTGSIQLNGSDVLTIDSSGNLTAPNGLTVTGTSTTQSLIPATTDNYDLGSASKVWRNIYTGDLNLSNEAKEQGNSVDGTKGSWTIQEGADNLFLVNNNSGKKYKFTLEEI